MRSTSLATHGQVEAMYVRAYLPLVMSGYTGGSSGGGTSTPLAPTCAPYGVPPDPPQSGSAVAGSETRYYPYGEVRTGGQAVAGLTDFTYTGQQVDAATGLMFYNARWYDPALGRFVSADTIVPEPGNPQALNRYAYVVNNPLKYIDPSGHGWISDTLTKVGRSSPVGKALVVGMANAVHHVNDQTKKVFWPDEGTTTGERLVACAEIGGGSVFVAAGAAEIATGGGILIKAARTGGGAKVAGTAGTVATAASADGDPTNEVKYGLNVFSRAAEFGIRTYNELGKLTKGTGLHRHHIIEKRFADRLGISPGQMQSVALTPAEHQIFTNAWRSLIPYSNSGHALNTLTATHEQIWMAAQEIYANYPALLEAARQTIFGIQGG